MTGDTVLGGIAGGLVKFGIYVESWPRDTWQIDLWVEGNERNRIWRSETIAGYDTAKALLHNEIAVDVPGWFARHPDVEAALMGALV